MSEVEVQKLIDISNQLNIIRDLNGKIPEHLGLSNNFLSVRSTCEKSRRLQSLSELDVVYPICQSPRATLLYAWEFLKTARSDLTFVNELDFNRISDISDGIKPGMYRICVDLTCSKLNFLNTVGAKWSLNYLRNRMNSNLFCLSGVEVMFAFAFNYGLIEMLDWSGSKGCYLAGMTGYDDKEVCLRYNPERNEMVLSAQYVVCYDQDCMLPISF